MASLSNTFNPVSKNVSKIEPLAAPQFYADIFDGKKETLDVAYRGGDAATFDFVERFDDKDSSFSAVLMQNKTDGHAVILFKGMDLPGRDEGAGRLGFIDDLKTVVLHKMGYETDQEAQANKVYDATIASDKINSLEVIGYSIGSIFTNRLAAEKGAKGTNIAELGYYTRDDAEETPDLSGQITSLRLRGDVIARVGMVGDVAGHEVMLDGDRALKIPFTNAAIPYPYPGGIAHVPQVYAAEAERRMDENPPALPSAAPKP